MADGHQRTTGTTIASGSRVIVLVSHGVDPAASGIVVPVPGVAGAPQGTALSRITDAGLVGRVSNDYSEVVARGRVIAQMPHEGHGASPGGDVHLLVSSGRPPGSPREVPLPDVVGEPEHLAVSALQGIGLSPQVVYAASATVPAGYVISQMPDSDVVAEVTRVSKNPTPWLWVALSVAAFVVAIVVFMLLRGGATAVVPDVLGMTQADATQTIVAAGFVVGDVTSGESPGVEPGTVLAQTPPAGQKADKGSAIDIVVVGEPEGVVVPGVVRMSRADATAALERLGLKVDATTLPDAGVAKGLVIRQTPQEGTKVAAGSSVAIVVSEGPSVALVSVPDVTGMSEDDARSALADAGFDVFRGENPSSDVPEGAVVAQMPAAGKRVAKGTTVAILVSSGPAATEDTVSVPNVVGMELARAQQVLADADLQPLPVKVDEPGEPGTVLAQLPAEGTTIEAGSAVIIFYAK